MIITASELQKRLEKAKNEHGDLEVYLNVDEDGICETCGNEHTKTSAGFCIRTAVIGVHHKPVFWLIANNGE